MKCKKCDGIMQSTGEIGSHITMTCAKCGYCVNRQPDDLMSKSMKRARRQSDKAKAEKVRPLDKEYDRLLMARGELTRKKESRAALVRRRQKAVADGKVTTLDDVIAKNAWKGETNDHD